MTYLNPLLPLDEYIPDGEPHVFDGRVYLYGSHDQAVGIKYCPLDYTVYSASVDHLDEWRCEGVIYHKSQDPRNADGSHELYAPDCVRGSDGRYYLYYVLEGIDAIGVAVCDTPAGHYEYYGEVKLPEHCHEKPIAFDPAILQDGERYYLAYGFSFNGTLPTMNLTPENTKGGYVVELAADMLTMKHEPRLVIPGYALGKGSSFEGHEFLEAASLRKFNNRYYFIYSSQAQHELCYAVSSYPDRDFTYQGILISNAGKLEDKALYKNNYANNHGSIVKINEIYAIFYHRHTYGRQYSRQACAEIIHMNDQGLFEPAQVTSQGLSEQPLSIHRLLPAAAACFVYDGLQGEFIPFGSDSMDKARIEGSSIVNITESNICFRYFEAIPDQITLNLLTDGSECGTVEVMINERLMAVLNIKGEPTISCSLKPEEVKAELWLNFHCPRPIQLESIIF